METLFLADAAGVIHRPAGEKPRIVSLVPSITELLFEMGLGKKIVGRTTFCCHPRQEIKAVPSVGGTKTVHLERIRGLKPTHVIVNVDETPRHIADAIAEIGCTLIVTHPIDVTDNLRLFRLIGALFDRRAEAESLCEKFGAELMRIKNPSATRSARKALYLIWKDPWMTVSANTYIARMLSLVNWRTVADDPTARYPTVELAEALLLETDLVLFSSEPFPFKRRHLEEFRAAFPDHADKAHPIDGQMVSWYGSRAIAGLRYLGDFASAIP